MTWNDGLGMGSRYAKRLCTGPDPLAVWLTNWHKAVWLTNWHKSVTLPSWPSRESFQGVPATAFPASPPVCCFLLPFCFWDPWESAAGKPTRRTLETLQTHRQLHCQLRSPPQHPPLPTASRASPHTNSHARCDANSIAKFDPRRNINATAYRVSYSDASPHTNSHALRRQLHCQHQLRRLRTPVPSPTPSPVPTARLPPHQRRLPRPPRHQSQPSRQRPHLHRDPLPQDAGKDWWKSILPRWKNCRRSNI